MNKKDKNYLSNTLGTPKQLIGKHLGKEPIYVLDHKIKWSVFKMLQDKLVRDSGPVPIEGDRVLWGLLKDKRIYCWFDPKKQGDMGLGMELPKNRPIHWITNPTPLKVGKGWKKIFKIHE